MLRISIIITVIILGLVPFFGNAQTKTFTEDFDYTSQIDTNYSAAKVSGGRAWVADNSLSSRIESTNISNWSSGDIEKAKISATEFKSDGSLIIYYLSSDGGKTWIQTGLDSWVTFSKPSKSIRWAAVITRASANSTTYIDSLKVEYQIGGENMKISNDGRRISDLRNVADAVNSFYKDNRFYPNVSGNTAETRWSQLGDLLVQPNRSGFAYIFSMPQPLAAVSGKIVDYDYKYFGNGYIVFANLESLGSWELEYDLDIITSSVDCRDPVYCVSGGSVPSKEAEVKEVPVKPVSNPRLIRALGDTKVYYITQKGYKRHVPSAEVFLSYGNKWSDVVVVDPSVLQNYPDNNLIYLQGDPQKKVFYVGYKSKSVLSKEAVSRRGLSLVNAAPVNRTEFNYYAIDWLFI